MASNGTAEFFTEEADKNITILEDLIKEADKKIKTLKKLKKELNSDKFIKSDKIKKITDDDKNNIKINNGAKNIKDNINVVEEIKRDKNDKSIDSKYLNDIDKILPNIQNNVKTNSIDNKNINEDFDLKNLSWEEKAFRMFENGFKPDEISIKLGKSIGEINFALKYIKLKKRLK